jgi:hypothetical protein
MNIVSDSSYKKRKNPNTKYLEDKRNYTDTIFTRHHKLKPTPCKLKKHTRSYRDIGTNTVQQLSEITSPVKWYQESQSGEVDNAPVTVKRFSSMPKPIPFLEMVDKIGYIPSFDPYSSSSEELILVSDYTDIYAMVNKRCKMGFGIEGTIVRRNFGLYPSYSLFIEEQFIMCAKTFTKNGNLRFVISTNQDLNANLKANLILGELRATSDSTFVLNSRKRKEIIKGSPDLMLERAAMVQEEVKGKENNEVAKRLVCIIPKLGEIKPFASIPPPFTNGLLKSYMNGKREDIWVLKCSHNPNSKDLEITSSTDKDNLLLCFEKVETNIFTLAMVYPFSPIQAFAICLTRLAPNW